MTRVLYDRYIVSGRDRVCDLVTGEHATLAEARPESEGGGAAILTPLIELLEHGRDGEPRRFVMDASSPARLAAFRRQAAAAARRHGYVALSLTMWRQWHHLLEDPLRDRALLLVSDGGAAPTLGKAAFLWAAALSARPHILLMFGAAASRVPVTVAREARPLYGSERSATGRQAPLSDDVRRQLARAARASAFMRVGRHAAADRLLRDVMGALERRGAHEAAARTGSALAANLLERGRTNDAARYARESVRLADAAGGRDAGVEARTLLAWTSMDAWRLTEAESLLRALLIAVPDCGDWPRITLARCLLVQGRIREARAVAGEGLPHGLDGLALAIAIDVHVRLALAEGDVFAAGQRWADGLEAKAEDPDPLVRTIVQTSRLRLLCASGDLKSAEASFRAVLVLARQAHAPLRAVRARIIWARALRRVERRVDDWRRVAGRLRRIAPRCPVALRQAALAACQWAGQTPFPRASVSPAPGMTVDLVHLANTADDDRVAMQQVLTRIADELAASRVEIVANDAAPGTMVTTGAGMPTDVGPRALESGIAVGFDDGGRQVAVPVRLGPRIVGALACRWPADRTRPPGARELLALSAAVIAPRVDAALFRAREQAVAATEVPELVGTSAAIAAVRRAIVRASRAPFAALIEGESGTGKELVARAIHQLGSRRNRRFCDVNCAAIPDELFDAELFGHARGAFTGAVTERAGLFEEADGGTLFLDEVADLSPRGQAKLLRAVQQQEVRRVGETFTRPVDVRLIAAANRDMQVEADEGRFRQDLLYRLNVIRIRMPALRERAEDVPVLARHFWDLAAARVGSGAALTPAAVAGLARYRWPGNVRELQNVMSALAVSAPARGRVGASLLPPVIGAAAVVSSLRLADARRQFDRRYVEAALAGAGGNHTRAAKALGVSRQGLLKLLARLNIGESANDAESEGSAQGA